MNPITAKGDHTSRCAGIFGVGVAIVTGLFTIPKHPITANRRRAGIKAGIGIDGVTIIALLTLLHHTIAAAGRLTSIARIGRVFIAVIAALTRADHAITTASL